MDLQEKVFRAIFELKINFTTEAIDDDDNDHKLTDDIFGEDCITDIAKKMWKTWDHIDMPIVDWESTYLNIVDPELTRTAYVNDNPVYGHLNLEDGSIYVDSSELEDEE